MHNWFRRTINVIKYYSAYFLTKIRRSSETPFCCYCSAILLNRLMFWNFIRICDCYLQTRRTDLVRVGTASRCVSKTVVRWRTVPVHRTAGRFWVMTRSLVTVRLFGCLSMICVQRINLKNWIDSSRTKLRLKKMWKIHPLLFLRTQAGRRVGRRVGGRVDGRTDGRTDGRAEHRHSTPQ